MTSILSIAASGMRASMVRLRGSAANVANAHTTGTVDPNPPAPKTPVYRPVDTVQRETPGGGTVATYRPRTPAYTLEHDPTSPNADENGMVAVPNVDLAQEAVSQMEAALSFRANVAVFRIAARMEKSLLDMTA